jgi:hypothetical protein
MGDLERGGAAGAETSDIGAVAAPGQQRRMTAGRKRDAVLRVLRGEPLEIVARDLAVTPHVAVDGNLRRSGKPRATAIDRRTTRHAGYRISQVIRKRVEESSAGARPQAGSLRSSCAA